MEGRAWEVEGACLCLFSLEHFLFLSGQSSLRCCSCCMLAVALVIIILERGNFLYITLLAIALGRFKH